MQNASPPRADKSLELVSEGGSLGVVAAPSQRRRLFGLMGNGARQDVVMAKQNTGKLQSPSDADDSAALAAYGTKKMAKGNKMVWN